MLIDRAAALLMVVLVSAPSAMADTTEIVGPMTIVMPSGWTRRAADPVMFHIAEASASGQDEGQIHVNAVQQPGATQAAVHGALWNQMLVTSGGMTETATVGGQDSADGADSILAGRRWSLTGAGCTCAGPSAGCRACIRYRVTKFAGGSSGSKGHPRTFS